MAFYSLEAEVAGEIGDNSVLDTTVHPPVVSRLEYRFTDWLGDCLLESFPCYIVSDPAAAAITAAGLTGVGFDTVEVTLSPEAEELMDPETPLPGWKWLKPTGQPEVADFAVREQPHRLIVSDKAREILEQHGLSNAEIEEL